MNEFHVDIISISARDVHEGLQMPKRNETFQSQHIYVRLFSLVRKLNSVLCMPTDLMLLS